MSPKSKQELDAVAELHRRGIVGADYRALLRQLNQWRKDYWYDGEDVDPDELAACMAAVEALVEDAEGGER